MLYKQGAAAEVLTMAARTGIAWSLPLTGVKKLIQSE
jgi:hypothetical protein